MPTRYEDLPAWLQTGLDSKRLIQETEEMFPLEQMIAGLGFGGPAPAIAKAGNLVGRIARTAKSLWPVRQAAKAAEQTPDRAAAWEALENLGLRKWLLDVPVTPRGSEPLAIRSATKGVGDLARSLHPDDSVLWSQAQTGGRPNPLGTFHPSTNIATYAKASQESTLPHELTHWSLWDSLVASPYSPREIDRTLAGLARRKPHLAEELRGHELYSKYTPSKMGEEILAGYVGHGARSSRFPIINDIISRATSALQPEMFRDAPRVPLEIPYVVGADLWSRP